VAKNLHIYAGFHLYAGRQEKNDLIGQLEQNLEFIIKLKGGQSYNFGRFFGQFFITNASDYFRNLFFFE
jgi:hypothetical protein